MDPLSSSGLYTRFLTANQSTQSMVFKNIQILSKSFWWIGECCAENSNIFISTSTPRVGTGQLLSQPGSLVRIAYWQANADGWTEFESVSGGCGWVVSARGTAASSPPPPRPVKRYQKSADGAGCLLNSKPQETFGPILGAPPAPAHTSPAQSINTLPIWTVSFSNHISQTWPSPQQMRRSANNSWAREMMKWKR